MTMTPEDALDLCRKMRMNLTQLQAQLTDVTETLAALPTSAKTQHICGQCGVQLRGILSLAEHLHTSHDGPIPNHWLTAERLAGMDAA